MSDRAYAKVQIQQKTLTGSSPSYRLLQRMCACGGSPGIDGLCAECREKRLTLPSSRRGFEVASASTIAQGNAPAQEYGLLFNAAFDRASRFGHDFSQIPIHSSAAGVIQTKLAVNQPGDIYEQEADRISEQIMRLPEPQLQRACAGGGTCSQCQTEQPDQEHERLQIKRSGSGDAGQSSAPPIVHEVLRSPGQPLDAATRAFMEPRFGYDFSRVRVHTDAAARQSAREMNAHAYTVGNDIVFGNEQFASDTHQRRLIAHELTHVVQQGSGMKVVQRAPADSGPHNASREKINPDLSKLVRATVEDLDNEASYKLLVNDILVGFKVDIRQWALQLKAIPHHESGNYLLRFFEELSDKDPKTADKFKELLAKKGVMIEEIALEWELVRLDIEEKSEHLRVQLKNYPIYDWKVALGGQLAPLVPIVNLIIHFIPVFGEALSAFEALLGREILTGRKLDGWEKLLAVLPYTGTILKYGKKGARAIFAISRETGLSTGAALRLIKNTSALSSDADRLREVKQIVDHHGLLTAEQQSTLTRAYDSLKPLEKEAGGARTAAQHPASASSEIKPVEGAPASAAKTGTSTGRLHGEAEAALMGAKGIKEETIKAGKLANYTFEHGGHTWQILKDGRIARCSTWCTFTSLEEAFGDLIQRHSRLKGEMARLKQLEGQAAEMEIATNLGKQMDQISRAERMPLKELEKLLDKPEFAKGTPMGNDLRFVRYKRTGGKLNFEECEPAAYRIWENTGAGSLREKELKEAFNLGAKNKLPMVNPDPKKASFIPDHIRGNPTSLQWGKPYHFEEIKDWANMSDTGNLSEMLDYVDTAISKISGSKLTIYYRNGTYMSGPLRSRIEGLMKKGIVELIPFIGA